MHDASVDSGPRKPRGIPNRFLIEDVSVGGHCQSGFRHSFHCGKLLFGHPSKKTLGNPGVAAGNCTHANDRSCPEATMIVFSRSFIRKRMISLATTASVEATSFALAQDPSRAFHVHGAMPARRLELRDSKLQFIKCYLVARLAQRA
jgi:hypothetical protein